MKTKEAKLNRRKPAAIQKRLGWKFLVGSPTSDDWIMISPAGANLIIKENTTSNKDGRWISCDTYRVESITPESKP